MKPRFRSHSSTGIGIGLVVFLASSIMLAAAAGEKMAPGDPDAGLTDSQRQQIYSAGRDSFNFRYESWVASLDPSTIDYGVLDRAPLLALYAAPEPTLGAAKARSALIVLGIVRSIRLTAFDGTYVTLDVVGVVKGNAPGTILIHQGGGLRPSPDWKGMFIADALDAPLLVPKDRALVFLQKGSAGFEIQGFTGLYRSKLGKLSAVEGNPFAGTVNGALEADFITTVKAQV